jgi:hypothetical protein
LPYQRNRLGGPDFGPLGGDMDLCFLVASWGHSWRGQGEHSAASPGSNPVTPRQDGRGPFLCGLEAYRTFPDHFELMNTFCVYIFELGPQDSLFEEHSLGRCIGAARTRRRRRAWSACAREVSLLVTVGSYVGRGERRAVARGPALGRCRSSLGSGRIAPSRSAGLGQGPLRPDLRYDLRLTASYLMGLGPGRGGHWGSCGGVVCAAPSGSGASCNGHLALRPTGRIPRV